MSNPVRSCLRVPFEEVVQQVKIDFTQHAAFLKTFKATLTRFRDLREVTRFFKELDHLKKTNESLSKQASLLLQRMDLRNEKKTKRRSWTIFILQDLEKDKDFYAIVEKAATKAAYFFKQKQEFERELDQYRRDWLLFQKSYDLKRCFHEDLAKEQSFQTELTRLEKLARSLFYRLKEGQEYLNGIQVSQKQAVWINQKMLELKEERMRLHCIHKANKWLVRLYCQNKAPLKHHIRNESRCSSQGILAQ